MSKVKGNDSDERTTRIIDLLNRSTETAMQTINVNRWPWGRLPLAQILLSKGDQDSRKQAIAIVEDTLASQEFSSRHPHCGNWLWLVGDKEIADINAVQFVMRDLLPLLLTHGERLSLDLLERCRRSVHLALLEEERMDMEPTYTNVHLVSLFALLTGGEWLKDEHFVNLGKDRWARWVRFTLQSGAPHEYNSPQYGGLTLHALALIQQYVHDPTVRFQARLLYERIWLHLALHIHLPTRQLAGPHSRCYWNNMMSGQNRVKEILWRETGWSWLLEPGSYGEPNTQLPANLELALTDHWLPDYVSVWLDKQGMAMPYEVRETANSAEGFDLTTFFTPSYALGTASKTYEIGTDCFYIEHQANYLILHYARPKKPGGCGMMYSRYVVNDHHWGTLGAAPDRPKTYNFYDQGHFAGVQLHNKAVGLYALMPQHEEEVFSLKTVVSFQSGDDLERVWVNDQLLSPDKLPYSVQDKGWLIVEDGSVYIGVHPLEPSCLGREAPIQLERGPLGELWLTIYNYRGPAKRFWDYASLRGAFWRGNLKAGLIVEVAERTEYPSAEAFLAHLKQATIMDTVDERHIRTVIYRSGVDEILLRYDLWNTKLVERRLNGQVYNPPNLTSPLAIQGNNGKLEIGQATLVTNPQQVWLVAQELDPKRRAWIAVNPEERPTPMRLETPCGVVTADEWGMGRLEWRAPEGGKQTVIIDALKKPAGLQVPDGVTVHNRAIL